MNKTGQERTGGTATDERINESPGVHRRSVLKAAGIGAFVGLAGVPTATATPSSTATGGPVALLGIDAEEGGPDGHGPITFYQGLANSLLSNVSNGGSGILIIGAKSTGEVTNSEDRLFWDAVVGATGETATYVNGTTNIASQTFSGFKMISVASSTFEVIGGITDAENDALAARAADIAAFVNGGGALFGLSQASLTNEWAYVASLGSFVTNTSIQQYQDVTSTAAGTALGLTDNNLDICCWHDVFLEYPSFLDVLATHNESGKTGFGEAAALGGANVVIEPEFPSETYELCGGQDILVGTVTVQETADGYEVTYETTDGWLLTETHVDVGDEFGDFPTVGRDNNPQVGRFDYTATHDAVTSYTEVVDDDDPQLDDVASDADCVLFAMHAVVVKEIAPDEFVSETAWVCPESEDAEPFNPSGSGNWATYVEFGDCE